MPLKRGGADLFRARPAMTSKHRCSAPLDPSPASRVTLGRGTVGFQANKQSCLGAAFYNFSDHPLSSTIHTTYTQFTMTNIKTVEFKPFSDQKPGTSGLRKKVVRFQEAHYSESFVTSILLSIPEGVKGSELVIAGDGRFWNPEVIQTIAKISTAYGVKKLLIGQNGILSTPAASHVIRKRKATGGILLTASHNAGGN